MPTSVFYGRQGEPSSANPRQAASKRKRGPCSCFEGLFNKLTGFPDENPAIHHHNFDQPKPLSKLPIYRNFTATEDGLGGLRVEASSNSKEGLPGWENQDSHVEAVLGSADCKRFVFGVFDGHGRYGHEISEVAARRVPGHLAAQQDLMKDPEHALKVAIKHTDDDIFSHFTSKVEYSGTTGTVILLDQVNAMMYCANVGDSRAVLGKEVPDAKAPRFEAVQLSEDLKPDLPHERERIEMSGGIVSPYKERSIPVGPPRVWESLRLEKPGLAVSRSLGDGCARTLGVIADPVITKRKITPEDRFILLGTDGLWDSVSNDQAMHICSKFITMPRIAMKGLVEAVRRQEEGMLADDTTAVYVSLR